MRLLFHLFLISPSVLAFVVPHGIARTSSSPGTTSLFQEADVLKKLQVSVDKDWTQSASSSSTWTKAAYSDGPGWSQISRLNFLETSVESERRGKEFEASIRAAEKEYERIQKSIKATEDHINEIKLKMEDAQKKMEEASVEKKKTEETKLKLAAEQKAAENKIQQNKLALKDYRATLKNDFTTEGGLLAVGVTSAIMTIAAARNGGRKEVVRELQQTRQLRAASDRFEPSFNQGFNSQMVGHV